MYISFIFTVLCGHICKYIYEIFDCHFLLLLVFLPVSITAYTTTNTTNLTNSMGFGLKIMTAITINLINVDITVTQ